MEILHAICSFVKVSALFILKMTKFKELLMRIPLLAWFLVPTLIFIVGGVFLMAKQSELSMDESKPGVGQPVAVDKDVEGVVYVEVLDDKHLAQGEKNPNFNSNPPTSGRHAPAPVKNGVYDKELTDEQFVHNLEHGYIWISYKKEIGDEAINKLKDIVTKDDWKVVMAPREANDSRIALSAWGRLLKMDSFDQAKVEDFIKTYRNRGPEKTPE